MQSASEQVIPAGMKPWSGGDSAPEDWDGGPIVQRNGVRAQPRYPVWQHSSKGQSNSAPHDIIAYTQKPTPSPAPMVEQAGEVEHVTKAAQAAEARYAEMYPEHADRIESIISAYTFDTPADRCRAHEVARAMGGHPRLNTRPAPAETEGVGQLADEIREALKAAYERGATDVHNYWTENPGEPPRGDPEFGEAAADYANEAMDPLSSAARGIAPSTPPADAGMLRELNLLREVEDAAADYCGRFMIDEAEDEDGSVCDEQQHLAAKRLCDALADFRAALNSQAHQIREGDHG